MIGADEEQYGTAAAGSFIGWTHEAAASEAQKKNIRL